ncbi:MAG: hypothetical protein A2Y80_09085 [Deltaproteobacteria bacterium RBG_13_58_19]|nr:MAG: hypothetical protein A2Y80_09085 [Deltaproteobacteria bacterium RBG_13_58_19]
MQISFIGVNLPFPYLEFISESPPSCNLLSWGLEGTARPPKSSGFPVNRHLLQPGLDFSRNFLNILMVICFPSAERRYP